VPQWSKRCCGLNISLEEDEGWGQVFKHIFSGVLLLTSMAEAQNLNGMPDLVNGKCEAASHIAEGNIGEDLTKRRSRFFCDSAIIVFFADNPNHVMVQFAERRAHHNQILGFAGLLDRDGINLLADHLYLETGHPISANFGLCKFFFKAKQMTGIWCGSKVDEGGRRTAVVVDFRASPGQ
jgi:hypothetical protein